MRGIVREIDKFGRVTIPKDLRAVLDLNIHDEVVFKIDGKGLRIEKNYKHPVCAITGEDAEQLFSYGNLVFSKEGARKLREVLNDVLSE